MKHLSNLFVILVALIHIGILILEVFFWNHPIGHRSFSMTPEVAQASTVLAMNQGLYNGFLAAGLFWGLLSKNISAKLFFLICVVIAGVFGAITAKPSILLIQALPAFIGIVFLFIHVKNESSKQPAVE